MHRWIAVISLGLMPLTAAEITVSGETNDLVEFGTAVIAEAKFKTNFMRASYGCPI